MAKASCGSSEIRPKRCLDKTLVRQIQMCVTYSRKYSYWQQVLSYKYQYQYQYMRLKYQYQYQYLACRYKYKYQYPKIVLKYRSSTSTSTQYNKTGRPQCLFGAADIEVPIILQ